VIDPPGASWPDAVAASGESMNRLSLITISMHELDRVKIIEAVLGRRM
jgi:hypothetical protein